MSNLDLQTIYDCYLLDPEHIEKDHVDAGKGARFCAESTYNVLESDGAEIHKVEKDNEAVGYFSSVKTNGINIMQFWFILPNCRNKENIIYFWENVRNLFIGDFYTSVYYKNKKALKHLKKQGFLEIENNENKIILKCH